ncbi:MAG: putative F420-dependent oxidoreductase, Rv2161c family protein [Deltaproteobacteria bacterium]|nr:putative F420-dependent oxidoreductase, Rv2161c family protein [Deltaproteobacteria bacterium]
MKYWISLVTTMEVAQFVEIAKFAEQVGFEGVSVPDHLVMPTKVAGRYPYTPDGKMWWPVDTPWPDPWVTLAAMGTATSRLRLASNIYLAALRDPFTAARAVGTAAVLTNDRIICGVAVGWIKEEYDLLGIDFRTRGKRLDEMLEVMHQLWTGKEVTHHGRIFKFEHALMAPAPRRRIPIWVGGASQAALRRAARNDGWLGVPMSNAQLLATTRNLYAMRKQLGKSGEPFDVVLSPMEAITPAVKAELESAGAHHVMALPWTPSPWGRSPWVKEGEDHTCLDVKCKAMERFAHATGL